MFPECDPSNKKITFINLDLNNKDDQRDAACSICLYYACGITLHVSGAL